MRGYAVAALALLGLFFSATPVSERIDLATLDGELSFLRKFHPKPAPDDIIIVGVDDATFRAIAEPLGLWHEHLGRALQKIAAAKPRAIGLDITLPDRSFDAIKPGLDLALMTGLARARENGPLVATLVFDSRTNAARTIHTPFLAVLGEEGLGIALLGRDADGKTRQFSLAIPTQEGSYPTLAGRLCRLMKEKCADGYIDFALGDPFKYVPLHEVLRSQDAEYLGKLFRGRVVLLGEAQRYTDRVSVPVNLAGWETVRHDAPGVVVHAAALRTGMHGKPPQPAGKPLMLLLVSAAALVVLLRDWRLALVSALVGTALLLALATALLHSGQVVDVAPAFFTLALAAFGRAGYSAWRERRDRERLRAAFGGYVSPPVLRAILKGDIRPGRLGEKHELAFIFADLRGSTAMTARTTPEAAMALLNRFHQVIAGAIHRHDGMLDNIRGDGVMAVFGAPKPLAEPAKAAFAALQDMFRGLERLNAELANEGLPALSMVAGLAYGEAVVGHVGARDRFNYTAIGDAVNVAARLQEAAKRHGVRAVLSGSAREKLPGAELEPLGPVPMEGHEPVEGWAWR